MLRHRSKTDNASKTVTATTGGGVSGQFQPISVKQFFALTFALGWGMALLMVLFIDQVEAIFGEVGYTNPVFILVVYSPGIAGIYLVWKHYGFENLGRFFRRLTLWRMPAVWWVFLIFGIPAVKYVSAAIRGTDLGTFPISPWYHVFPAIAAALLIGPMEEFGWRGVALPLLQRRFTPLWASLILGAVWGLWHAPAFLLSGTEQSAWSFGPFIVGVLAISVILTPMFNAAQGSILIAMLYHFQMNGPAWPDAQPWENWVFALVAIVIVILCRKSMFTREGAATDIIIGESEIGGEVGALVPSSVGIDQIGTPIVSRDRQHGLIHAADDQVPTLAGHVGRTVDTAGIDASYDVVPSLIDPPHTNGAVTAGDIGDTRKSL